MFYYYLFYRGVILLLKSIIRNNLTLDKLITEKVNLSPQGMKFALKISYPS